MTDWDTVKTWINMKLGMQIDGFNSLVMSVLLMISRLKQCFRASLSFNLAAAVVMVDLPSKLIHIIWTLCCCKFHLFIAYQWCSFNRVCCLLFAARILQSLFFNDSNRFVRPLMSQNSQDRAKTALDDILDRLPDQFDLHEVRVFVL